MTEDIETSTQQPVEDGIPSATEQQRASVQERAAVLANERPEVAAGAAFAGGLFLALILKRIAR